MDERKGTVLGMVGSPFLFFRARRQGRGWCVVPEARDEREGEREFRGSYRLHSSRSGMYWGGVGSPVHQAQSVNTVKAGFFVRQRLCRRQGCGANTNEKGERAPNNPDDYRTPWSRGTMYVWMNFVL